MQDKDGYLEYVTLKAREAGKEFVLDSGEGKEYFDNERGWYIENLSGWLVDFHDVEAVKTAILERNTDRYSNCYVFVYWKVDMNNNLDIRFEYVPSYD
ncbi:hypothetical protein ACFCP7_28210 [Paenibacillus elgii]